MARTLVYKLYMALRGIFQHLTEENEIDDYLTAEEQEQLTNIYFKIKKQIFGDDD